MARFREINFLETSSCSSVCSSSNRRRKHESIEQQKGLFAAGGAVAAEGQWPQRDSGRSSGNNISWASSVTRAGPMLAAMHWTHVKQELEIEKALINFGEFVQHRLDYKSGASSQIRGMRAPSQIRGMSAPSQIRGMSAPSQIRGISVPSQIRGMSAPSQIRGISAPSQIRGMSAPSQIRGMRAAAPYEMRAAPDEMVSYVTIKWRRLPRK